MKKPSKTLEDYRSKSKLKSQFKLKLIVTNSKEIDLVNHYALQSSKTSPIICILLPENDLQSLTGKTAPKLGDEVLIPCIICNEKDEVVDQGNHLIRILLDKGAHDPFLSATSKEIAEYII